MKRVYYYYLDGAVDFECVFFYHGSDSCRFNDVRPDNAGVYRCQVRTDRGTYHEDYTLTVHGMYSLRVNRGVEVNI